MIKNGLKTYFKSLPYIFVILGVLFVAVLLGGTVLLKGVASLTDNLISSILGLFDGVEVNLNGLLSFLVEDMGNRTNWSVSEIFALLNGNWLFDSVYKFLIDANPDLAIAGESLSALITDYVADVESYIVKAYIIVLLGVFGGYFLTKYLVRRDSAKRSIWKWALISVIDSVLSATVVAFVTYLLSLWSPSVIFTFIISGILFGLISLFEAYIVHGYKVVDIKVIVTGKNALLLLFVNILNFIVSLALVIIISFLFNPVIAVVSAYALIILSMIVTSLNAETYVVSERDKLLAARSNRAQT